MHPSMCKIPHLQRHLSVAGVVVAISTLKDAETTASMLKNNQPYTLHTKRSEKNSSPKCPGKIMFMAKPEYQWGLRSKDVLNRTQKALSLEEILLNRTSYV